MSPARPWIAAAAAAPLILVGGGAQAACTFGGGPFSAAKGGTLARTMTTDGPCRVRFRPTDEQTLTGLRIVRPPRYGALRLIGGFAYEYAPARDHAGADRFSIAVCARQSGRLGCATLVYAVTVMPRPP